MSHRRSFFSLRAPVLAAVMLAAGLSATLPASAGSIPPSATNLSGTADRMVSYRHQEHSWVTPDGMFHLMYSRGDVPTGDGLQLASSTDGVTWTPQLSMDYTGDKTTSDGSFNSSNSLLSVVYSTAVNDIRFAPLKYDSTAKTWKLKGSGQTVRAQVNSNPASNPTVVEDANGDLWVAFLEQKVKNVKKQTGTAKVRLFYRPKDGKQKDWVDTGIVFGDDKVVRDLGAPKLSARIVRTPNGLGMIYALGDDIWWAQRPLSGTPQDKWSAPQILVAGTPGQSDTDPYSSHFNVITDGDGFMHMVYTDGGIPYYRRYNAQPDVLAWSASSLPLTSVANDAAYPQVSWLGGKQIAIVVNGKAQGKLSTLRVYQSASRGAQGSFVCTDQLTHPDPTGTSMSFIHMRNEMPGSAPATGVPVVMQYGDTVNGVTTYKAYGYRFAASSTAGCQ